MNINNENISFFKAVSLHPGVVTTEIWRNLDKMPFLYILSLILRPLIWFYIYAFIHTFIKILIHNYKLKIKKIKMKHISMYI